MKTELGRLCFLLQTTTRARAEPSLSVATLDVERHGFADHRGLTSNGRHDRVPAVRLRRQDRLGMERGSARGVVEVVLDDRMEEVQSEPDRQDDRLVEEARTP